MGIIIGVILPLSLFVIMFSLGLGLVLDDFTRVARQPKAFLVGALSQLVMLPVVALAVATGFGLAGELAVGLMILAFCPGGVTSNILTKLARGDLALSISLTGIISLVAVFTVPWLVKLSADHFLGMQAPEVDVTALGLTMFAITAVPVILGMLVRRFAPAVATKVEPVVEKVALVLFVLVVVGAIAANWQALMDNLLVLGPSVVVLNALLLALGLILARIFSLNEREATAIAIETGIQNATLGITIGTLIVEQANNLPPFSLPSGVYGITMYAISIPFVLWRRGMAQTAALTT